MPPRRPQARPPTSNPRPYLTADPRPALLTHLFTAHPPLASHSENLSRPQDLMNKQKEKKRLNPHHLTRTRFTPQSHLVIHPSMLAASIETTGGFSQSPLAILSLPAATYLHTAQAHILLTQPRALRPAPPDAHRPSVSIRHMRHERNYPVSVYTGPTFS